MHYTQRLRDLRAEMKEEGFTLTELMITVVIVGVLAAVAIPIFMNQIEEANKVTVKSDVQSTAITVASADPHSDLSEIAPVVTEGNAVVIDGTWDNYTITGTNSSGYCYRYASVTGRSTECAPTGGAGGSHPGTDIEDVDDVDEAARLYSIAIHDAFQTAEMTDGGDMIKPEELARIGSTVGWKVVIVEDEYGVGLEADNVLKTYSNGTIFNPLIEGANSYGSPAWTPAGVEVPPLTGCVNVTYVNHATHPDYSAATWCNGVRM